MGDPPMMNYYELILWLLTAAGVGITAWGCLELNRARQRKAWPTTQAVVIESTGGDDILPEIVYRYTVSGTSFDAALELPAGTEPSEELTRDLLERYAAGRSIEIRYDPAEPHRTEVVDLGGSSVWLIITIGIATTAFGIFALI